MSIQTIINGLNVTFNNNVKTLLNYCNSSIKNIINSKLTIRNKNNNIKQIQIYFNTNYNNLKNKLNLDIAQAQVQAQTQVQAQVQTQTNKVNKNALLIGCNYIGTQNELNGCINDVAHNSK